ncbi:MAG: hypothetical protein WCT04_27870, partial [Planctomycetota bacterium]
REGEIVLTIREDGTVRLQILNNDSPGHGELLTPLEQVLSDGDAAKVHAHRHDHTHEHQAHLRDGGAHK